jgi:hypothetical protein
MPTRYEQRPDGPVKIEHERRILDLHHWVTATLPDGTTADAPVYGDGNKAWADADARAEFHAREKQQNG